MPWKIKGTTCIPTLFALFTSKRRCDFVIFKSSYTHVKVLKNNVLPPNQEGGTVHTLLLKFKSFIAHKQTLC